MIVIFLSGLTSVTFRGLDYVKIIELAARCGLDGIEWGGDVHVPPGNTYLAECVRKNTLEAGLKVLSYGSYFKAGDAADAVKEFAPVLDSAVNLGAPIIRIWAGSRGSAGCGIEYEEKVICQTEAVCKMAENHGITVCYEYHPNTLTDNSGSALRLLRAVRCGNLKTYWQPYPPVSRVENKRQVEEVLPYIENVHIFNWAADYSRHGLEEGIVEWQEYLEPLRDDSRSHCLIMEFVKNDSQEQFIEDSEALMRIIKMER